MSAAISQRELDDLVLRLKGLVSVRALLERRGASVPRWVLSHINSCAASQEPLA